MHTVVAETITELIHFESKICICNGNSLKFKGESVTVTRDSLPIFHRSVSGNCFFLQHVSVSVIGIINCPEDKCLSVIILDTTVVNSKIIFTAYGKHFLSFVLLDILYTGK